MHDKDYQVIIIGAGFSGLCIAIKLQQAGLSDFLILEGASEVGGTWRENTYPGAECDIPSALYSYSFEHNSAWEFKWSEQQQIFDYQKNIAKKYDLYEKVAFDQQVESAVFDEDQSVWSITSVKGDTFRCQHVVSAVGQLHLPAQPDFAGEEHYTGAKFHSAKWDHSVELAGKRVAVIGNAASALQFIPQIAPLVEHLTVFQRSANWVIAKQDRSYGSIEQWVSEKVPLITRLYRLSLWLRGECLVLPAMRRNRIAQRLLKWMAQKSLRRVIQDPELIRKLTPDYPIGAKRILFSDDYYGALVRNNVHLDTSGVKQFTEQGILRNDGVEESFDVVIYGTGFKTNPFLASIDVQGLGGRLLREHWHGGAHAYLGITTYDFPNFYMMYGPNTNLGHNSIIIMIEAQARYIVKCIERLKMSGQKTLQVKEAVESKYNEEIQARLKKMSFADVKESWYMDGGRITNNWAGSTLEYRRRLRKVNWNNYLIT
jgi:cation diffusion facilitator CzcD-associated flavoprotein CzcO